MPSNREKTLYLVVGLVLIIAAGWLVLRQPQEKNGDIITDDTIVQETNMTERKTNKNNGQTYHETKALVEEAMGKYPTDTISLQDVTGNNSLGTAYRAYADNMFYHKAVLTDLPGLEKGYYLEGWLVNPDGAYFSTGRVMPEGNNGLLYYVSDVDQSDYNKVVITLEPEDNNPAPADHLLEGEF